jgi:hypothetical protein
MQLHPNKCKVLQITTKTPLQSKYTSTDRYQTTSTPPSTWVWTSIKPLAGTYTSIKWLRRHTTPCHSQAKTSVVGQQTSKLNAIPYLWDHLWNTHLQIGAHLRIKASARSRQSNAELFVSPLVITDEPAVLWRRWNKKTGRRWKSDVKTPAWSWCIGLYVTWMTYHLLQTYNSLNYTVLVTSPLSSMCNNQEHQCTGSHTSCKPSDCRTICPDPW